MTERADAISPNQFVRLVDLAGELAEEADRCAKAGCWRAATVLLGSAIEAAIAATACALEPELRANALWPARGWGDLATQSLGRLIVLAKKAGWLPVGPLGDAHSLFESLDGDTEHVGRALQFLQTVRNMATHPGRYVSESVRPEFDDPDHMEPTYRIVEGIQAGVFEHLHRVMTTAD